MEEIPIDVGRRYHRITSVDEFVNLSVQSNSTNNFGLRRGDKVAVIVPQQELEEMRSKLKTAIDDVSKVPGKSDAESHLSSFDAKVNELRGTEISVEIRDSQPKPNDEIAIPLLKHEEEALDLEELSPKATFEAYIENEVASGALGESTAKKLLRVGEDVLKDISDIAASEEGASTPLAPDKATTTDIDIESVSVVGFGTFKQEVFYPLRKRG